MPDSTTTIRQLFRMSIIWLTALASATASAHGGADPSHTHGWMAGLLHPMLGADHLAVMVAVGIWGARLPGTAWSTPIAFTVALLTGALLAQAGISLPWIEPTLVASLFVMALLVLTQANMGTLPSGLLVGSMALFHGAAHGQELVGAGALFGMVTATALLHLTGMALGRFLLPRYHWMGRTAALLLGWVGALTAWTLVAAH